MPIITPPNTKTQTSHALTITKIGDSAPIGAINQWNPDQQLQVVAVFEFGQVTGPYGEEYGAPYEKVPGNLSNMTIQAQRYDIYTSQYEEAFGTLDLSMLTRDPGMTNGGTGHLDLREQWTMPAATPVAAYSDVYYGCWFTRIGRTMQTTNDRIINVNGTIEYTKKLRLRAQ